MININKLTIFFIYYFLFHLVLSSPLYHNPKAMYNESLFEGDIIGSYPDIINDGTGNPEMYNAISQNNYLWPNGKMFYRIGYDLYNEKPLILKAMQYISAATNNCITFEEINYELKNQFYSSDYVVFISGQGCYSSVGRQGGVQHLSLGRGCGALGIAIHEILHALGFYHHHSRSDRDEYLSILYNNISPQMYMQFSKLQPWQNQLYTEFDYDSIMIYGSDAFSYNGKPTMVPIKNPNIRLINPGFKNSMTMKDIFALKSLYNC